MCRHPGLPQPAICRRVNLSTSKITLWDQRATFVITRYSNTEVDINLPLAKYPRGEESHFWIITWKSY